MTSNTNGGFLLYRQKPDFYSADTKPGYEIKNAFTFNPSIVFESNSSSVTINFSYTEARKIEALVFANHNIPETATKKLRYCTDDTYSNYIEKDIPWAEKNTYLIDTTTSSYNYFQIYISSSAPIQIGCIIPYLTAFQFPHQFSYTYKKRYIINKDVDTSDEGLHIETPTEDEETPTSYYEFTVKFNDVDSQYYNNYKKLIFPGNKVFIPSFTKVEGYYGIVASKSLDGDIDIAGDTYSLEFREHAITEKQEV